MPQDWWPAAVRREVPYWPQAGRLPRTPIGWILHVTVMNGSPWSLFTNAVPPTRRFSHLWFAKSGLIEQYAPLSSVSWAQVSGNPVYWSCETEGFPNEPLSRAQLDALAAWHVFSGSPDALAASPGQPGIGTHYMGGAAWGGHSCPDPVPGAGPRSRQRPGILTAAAALRAGGGGGTDPPLTAQDLAQVAAVVWGARFGNSPTTGTMLQRTLQDPQAVARAVVAALPVGARPLSSADVELAVEKVLRAGL